MTLLLNILWFIFGGFLAGLAWLLGALILAITIVGLPWAGAAWRIGMFSFAPFGKQLVDRDLLTGRGDLGTGPMGLLLNIIWLLLAGWYIALAHVAIAIPQAISIIGLPFAWQHLKLALAALTPIGKTVVRA